MKKFIVLAVLAMSSVSFADGAGTGAEEVIADGGLTTIVGGGCVATSVQNGENSEITYSGECYSAPTMPSQAEATQAVYAWVNGKLQLVGYIAPDYNDGSTGN